MSSHFTNRSRRAGACALFILLLGINYLPQLTLRPFASIATFTISSASALPRIATPILVSDEVVIGSAGLFFYGSTLAYNSLNREFLVVWDLNIRTEPGGPEASYVYGRRVDAATGNALGDVLPIFGLSSPSSNGFEAGSPDVAYNSAANEYFVVWRFISGGEWIIFGQRLDAASGAVIGEKFALTSSDERADKPQVTYNSVAGEYLVTHRRRGNSQDGDRIIAQRWSSEGTQIGTSQPEIAYAAYDSQLRDRFLYDVTFNPSANQYLVVWDDGVNGETEIRGKLLDGFGAPLSEAFQISSMHSLGLHLTARQAALVHGPAANEYLVVWREFDNYEAYNTPGDPPGAEPDPDATGRIYAQRLTSAGALIGEKDFPVSSGQGSSPDVIYNSRIDEYLVAWRSPLDTFLGRRVDLIGMLTGPGEIELADASAVQPQLMHGGASNSSLVVYGKNQSGGSKPVLGRRILIGSTEMVPLTPKVTPVGRTARIAFPAEFEGVSYRAVLQRSNRNVASRQTTQRRTTFKNLASGTYRVRYRIVIGSETTKYSAYRKFRIQ